MIGRTTELNRLTKSLIALKNGQGCSFSIVGEPGLGKTHLLTHLQKLDLAHQVTWAVGQSLDYNSYVSYMLTRQLLWRLLDVNPYLAEVDLKQSIQTHLKQLFSTQFLEVYPYLGHLLQISLDDTSAQRVEYLSAKDLHHLILHTVKHYIIARAKEQPVAIVCDSLQWADPSSLNLIESLLPLTQQHPIAVYLSYRPLKQSLVWTFHETITQAQPYNHQLIELPPLSNKESEQLLLNLLGKDSLDENPVWQTLLKKADGNPLYLQEISNLVSGNNLNTLIIPDILSDVIMARIDHLDPSLKQILQIASVIGVNFPYNILAKIFNNNK